MTTNQEEGDTIIVQQIASVKPNKALVVADDTDIFVLLLHFTINGQISCPVTMVSPVKGRAAIDIRASVEKHHEIIPDLLATHGLTGCDTVATYFGIGKGIALKVLRTGRHSLSFLGDTSVHISEIRKQATLFMSSCYGVPECQSMTNARQKLWASKVGRSTACAPKLPSLPPTDEAFMENVARAHLQVAVWKKAIDAMQPVLDATVYGWYHEQGSSSLSPTPLPENVPLAPEELLKLIRCTCSSENACKTRRCSCNSSTLACTIFCSCQGSHACFNEYTKQVMEVEDEED